MISGNLLDGVALSAVDHNQVKGNCIGVGPDGVYTFPNGHSGVRIDAGSTNNLIGGDRASGACKDTCNTIAHNTQWGVIIADAGTTGNTVRGNDIYQNGKLGINLEGGFEQGNGVTANNPPEDYPFHPNDLMYHPVGVMAHYDFATNHTLISGVLPWRPPRDRRGGSLCHRYRRPQWFWPG